METLTLNRVGRVRKVREGGRDYLVAPLTLIVPGVLNGSRESELISNNPGCLTGVYAIINTANQKVYIGSAACSLTKRLSTHKRQLRKGTHPNEHLQRSWNHHGEPNFKFVKVWRCAPEHCTTLEQLLITACDSTNDNKGYNRCKVVGSPLGLVRSVATRKKMSEAAKVRWQNTPLSEESKAKIAKSLTGRKLSKESIEKRSAKLRGRPRDKGVIERVAAMHRGSKRSPEACARISEGKRRASACKRSQST